MYRSILNRMALTAVTVLSPSLLCLSSLSLSSCGGTDTVFGGGGRTNVNEIDADDTVLALGEGTVVTFNFSFDNDDVFNDEGNVRLVVRLPEGLKYREDSAEIDQPGSGDRDVGAQLLQCSASGESYLLFDMDRFDLRNANAPDVDSDAQLKLTVDGVRRGSTLVIEARADKDRVAYGCGQSFVPDEQEVVSVS